MTPLINRLRSPVAVTAFVVAVAAVWVHGPCVQGGFLTGMDDDEYMAKAGRYGGLTFAGARWAFAETWQYYHPLPRLTHLLAYSIWGTQAWGHHAVNLFLHVCNSVLTTILALRLLQLGAGGAEDQKTLCVRLSAAAFAGLIFAVHPLQTESVAWIAGRTQLLCAGLMLGSVLAYIEAAETDRAGWRWMSGAFYVAAWLSKPIVATLPVILLVLDWYPLRRNARVGWRALIREKLWMFAVAVGFTALTFYCASQSHLVRSLETWGFVARALIPARAVMFYISKLLWPVRLSPFYPLPKEVSFVAAPFWLPALMVLTSCVCVWFCRRRWPALTAASLAFLALLLPESGLTQFASYAAANRHMYIAMLPLLMLAASASARLWERMRITGRAMLLCVVVVGIVCLAHEARLDVRMWHDDETLWSSILRWYPNAYAANKRIANAAIARRDFVAALPYARRALESKPEDQELRGILGLVYLKTRNYEAAANTLEPLDRPDIWMPAARYNLACAYARLGSNDSAMTVLSELLPRAPGFAEPALHDGELAGLRNDPEYGPRFAALVAAAKK